MRKRLAQWFLLVAKRLDPDTHIENAQVVENYEAQKIGLTYIVTKKDIKDYRFKDGARMSLAHGKKMLLNETRRKIRMHIIGCIDINRLIEYEIKKEDDGFKVSGELKVYVPKHD